MEESSEQHSEAKAESDVVRRSFEVSIANVCSLMESRSKYLEAFLAPYETLAQTVRSFALPNPSLRRYHAYITAHSIPVTRYSSSS